MGILRVFLLVTVMRRTLGHFGLAQVRQFTGNSKQCAESAGVLGHVVLPHIVGRCERTNNGSSWELGNSWYNDRDQ